MFGKDFQLCVKKSEIFGFWKGFISFTICNIMNSLIIFLTYIFMWFSWLPKNFKYKTSILLLIKIEQCHHSAEK